MKTQSKQIGRIKLVKEGSKEHYACKEKPFVNDTYFDGRYPEDLIEEFKSKFNSNIEEFDNDKMKEYVLGLDLVNQMYIMYYILLDMGYEFKQDIKKIEINFVGQKEFSELRSFLIDFSSENYRKMNTFLEKNNINCVMLHDSCLGICLDYLDENGDLCESKSEEYDFDEDYDKLEDEYKNKTFTLQDMLMAYESGGQEFKFVKWIKENFEAKI